MISSETTVRPWGHYKVLSETGTFKIKEIVVQPGQRLSLQRKRPANPPYAKA